MLYLTRDALKAGHGVPMSEEISDKYMAALNERDLKFFSQFEGAELMAEKYDISREDMEQFAVASHAKAVAATEAGYFTKEILSLQGKDKEGNEVVHDAVSLGQFSAV